MNSSTEIDASADLQARIALIAASAKTRNPEGYKLTPVSSLTSSSSHSSGSPSQSPNSQGSYDDANFINVRSGQVIMLLDSARNMSPYLQVMPM
mmetsp:Transcript_14454/g.27977  ORF Transcript_14454/g.27977 Transcript_14454/m.27977 type:complete len:94 (-) Transcript_14454:1649-1930(-)|eukprot:CAMPEP_0171495312 /NCGR_PEP_ID=MMETSP0958-20121227/6078_1 /TAXON_ID=87120 /ORGANISM="Aurantiochytrium limacinum, Strain ATCCMYA-1381" /LENGTH=93 /DNA_ID=CAMNT_0012029293 /DNA_START=787 /DNA_END=1068 /DNA_ORIENTATION=+